MSFDLFANSDQYSLQIILCQIDVPTISKVNEMCPEICVSVPRQIDRSIKSKRCTQFLSYKYGNKYECGRNLDYIFYMYDY